MRKISFRENQLASLEILKAVDDICRNNGFTYFLMYGSLIGAVRDKGIIPWDDDIDVMMPRPSYDRFIRYCAEHGDEIQPFCLFENSLNPDYPHPIARMSDQRYRLEFENEKDYGIGLFVDIYPLDGVGNDRKRAQKLVRSSYRNASLCFLTSRKGFGIDNTRSMLRMIIKFPAYLWANLCGNAHYIKKSERLCRKNSYESSKFVSGVAQPFREKWGENKNIYEKEWFELTETQFEDKMFYIPKGYDCILRMGYGDYMQPPPENQRTPHHMYEAYQKSDAVEVAARVLQADIKEIQDIQVLKRGMTNNSFLFTCRGKRYIMRIPGMGTDLLINRVQEASVYQAIKSWGISDDVIYIDPASGYKITAFLENSRNCNPVNERDLIACMKKLRDFHNLDIKVDHCLDLFEQIDFYERLWGQNISVFSDYTETKAHVNELREYIEEHVEHRCLTHIDAVHDNFLFTRNSEEPRMIDWEYAGMQDPHVDVAMFCIYAMYEREQVDHLIDLYFENQCKREIRLKIYCYIAVCGLLWSNWCEYKRHLGVEFGEYADRQYRYAVEYYRIFVEERDDC